MINHELQQLLRQSYQGALSTHSVQLQGYPFGSVVPFCLDYEGRVVILISDLAQHTKNLKQDNKCSLLVFAEGDDMQASARLTIVANAKPIAVEDVADIASRYYRYFPQSQDFHKIHDFSFWLLEPVKYRYIGGFGRIHWVEPELLANPFTALQEQEIVEHMNQDHADTFVWYCQQAQISVPQEATLSMVGLDSAGFYLRVNDKIAYVDFPQTVNTPMQVRQSLVAMLKSARATGVAT